jgi:hypothetical protein
MNSNSHPSTLDHAQRIVQSVFAGQVGKMEISPKVVAFLPDGGAITCELQPANAMETVMGRRVMADYIGQRLRALDAVAAAVIHEIVDDSIAHAIIETVAGDVRVVLVPTRRDCSGRITGNATPSVHDMADSEMVGMLTPAREVA